VRKTRFSEEQIIAILKEGEAVPPAQLSRLHLSEVRNATSFATSDGLFGRPSGIPPSMFINFYRAVV
jgi:hypothetical protein